MTAPRPIVHALLQQTADTEGYTTAELRRRQPKRVAAFHALGTALDNLGGYTYLDMYLRVAITNYLTDQRERSDQ